MNPECGPHLKRIRQTLEKVDALALIDSTRFRVPEVVQRHDRQPVCRAARTRTG